MKIKKQKSRLIPGANLIRSHDVEPSVTEQIMSDRSRQFELVFDSGAKKTQRTQKTGTPAVSVKSMKIPDRETFCTCKNSPILVVDDDVFNIMTLKMMIKQKFKLEPEVASNGLEALTCFKKRLESTTARASCPSECKRGYFQLIFMDLNMPVMDGFDSSKEILNFQEDFIEKKEKEGIRQIPRCKIVALTAFVGVKNIERCREVGMAKVLNKPAHIKEIVSAIKQFVPFLKLKQKHQSRMAADPSSSSSLLGQSVHLSPS